MKHAGLAVAALSVGVALSIAASGQDRPGRDDASAMVSTRPSSSLVLPSGLVLVAGGAPRAETYDPLSRTFTIVAGDARMAGQFSAVAPLKRGGALSTGGYGDCGGPRASAWLYRP